jgi:hypothetical protein
MFLVQPASVCHPRPISEDCQTGTVDPECRQANGDRPAAFSAFVRNYTVNANKRVRAVWEISTIYRR